MSDEWTGTTCCESTLRLRFSPAWYEFVSKEPSATEATSRCDTGSLELDLWLQTLHDVAHLELG
jgi:hypothetical protein